MGATVTTRPNIPEPNEHNLVEAVRAIKEILEVGQKERARGDDLDAWVTFRDLTEYGSVKNMVQSFADAGQLTLGDGDRPPQGSQFPGGVDPTTLYLPGRPTNVRTNAVWDGIMVKWDWPDQSDPLISWARAAIWVSGSESFDDGALQGYTTSNFWVDANVGLSTPDGNTGVRYYWVRYEDWDDQTEELIYTDWSPYSFESGVRGQTALNTEFTVDTFTVACGAGEAVNPFVCGEIVTGYDEDGEPIIEIGVGLSGQLIIHGSITADQLQAGIIGADLINAQEVWAEIANTELLITQGFTTRNTLDFRLEINGWGGEKAQWPLWYGRGITGGDDGLFWIENGINEAGDWMWSSLYLSGELIVTGAGKFFAGNVTHDADGNLLPDPVAARIEIGGPDTDFLLWAGSGLTGTGDDSNPIFYIDNDGNAVFNGTVEAKYVSGEISRTHVIREYEEVLYKLPDHNHNNYTSLHNDDDDWVTVKEWDLGAPPFDYGHVPCMYLAYDAYGTGFVACAMRIQVRDLQFPDVPWQTVFSDICEIGYYANNFNVSLATWRMYGRSRFRMQFAKVYDNTQHGIDGYLRVKHANRNGMLIGVR